MAKTKKALAATAADPFFDANGHALAVNDVVLISEEGASIYNGHSGTITGMHREGASAVATVAFKGDSTVAAGSQAFFLKWLTYMASHPAIQEEPDLPWLDCDGNVLHEGDKATVLPDVSERLSGKLVKVLGDYDPKAKSVQVEPVGWEGADFGILLCFLKRLPVLGENLEERIVSGVTSMGQLDPELAAKFNRVAKARARRQQPVAPFAVAGQAAHEAAQPPITSADIEEAANTPTATTAPVAKPEPTERPLPQAPKIVATVPRHGTDAPFEWNEYGVCPNPTYAYEAEKGKREFVKITVAQTPDGDWVTGHDFAALDSGSSSPTSLAGERYETSGMATTAGARNILSRSTAKELATSLRKGLENLLHSLTAPTVVPANFTKPSGFDAIQAGVAAHQAGLRLVPLASIVVTTNTRKVFDETALAELAESVRAHGILQPIVLRPHGTESGKYELVAGGRRYQAAQRAGLAEVPATVRNLTDREFLEVQLLENLQRVDVRPADEAEAFAKLLANGYSAEEIGLKVGKGAKFVAQRAKLATLMPFWFDALQEERLPLVAATEIARLPDESQSRLEEVAMRDYSLKQPGAIFKADWIKGTIKSYVLRELNAAAFPKHDAKLYAVAGACTTCPKRSGAVKQLFDEEELKHDYCLDGACFQHKKEAFVEQQCATLKQSTGKPAVRISTDYYQVPKGTLDCYSYKEAKEGAPGAVQAVLVNGSEMGQMKWVVVRANPGAGKSEADKEADAKRLRTERLTKTHRALIAEKLTTDLPAALATQGPVYESILTYLLFEECSSAKETLAYLRESWGWEPSEAALKDDYNDKDARGFRPWKRFVLEMVGPLSLEQKLEMYLALKVRHRMHYDYEDRQFTIAKLVAGHGYPELAAEAEQAVEERYYTRKGQKQGKEVASEA